MSGPTGSDLDGQEFEQSKPIREPFSYRAADAVISISPMMPLFPSRVWIGIWELGSISGSLDVALRRIVSMSSLGTVGDVTPVDGVNVTDVLSTAPFESWTSFFESAIRLPINGQLRFLGSRAMWLYSLRARCASRS